MRALKRGFKWNGLFIANMNMLTTSLLLKAKYVAVHFLRYNCASKFNYENEMKTETSFKVFFLKQHRKNSLKNIIFS